MHLMQHCQIFEMLSFHAISVFQSIIICVRAMKVTLILELSGIDRSWRIQAANLLSCWNWNIWWLSAHRISLIPLYKTGRMFSKYSLQCHITTDIFQDTLGVCKGTAVTAEVRILDKELYLVPCVTLPTNIREIS